MLRASLLKHICTDMTFYVTRRQSSRTSRLPGTIMRITGGFVACRSTTLGPAGTSTKMLYSEYMGPQEIYSFIDFTIAPACDPTNRAKVQAVLARYTIELSRKGALRILQHSASKSSIDHA